MKIKRDGWGFVVNITPKLVQRAILLVSVGMALFVGLKLHDRALPQIRVPGNAPTNFQPGFVYWTETNPYGGVELLIRCETCK